MFKTRLDTFGNDFGHFWIFETFLTFLKIFEDSTLHGTLGKSFFFEKKHLKTCSRHVWTLLGTILGIFGFLKIFDCLKNFEDSTLHGTLGKSFVFEKNTRKHIQNTFGHFWERFWAF